jgi:hypothetical protein
LTLRRHLYSGETDAHSLGSEENIERAPVGNVRDTAGSPIGVWGRRGHGDAGQQPGGKDGREKRKH